MALVRIEREIALNGGMDTKASVELAPEVSMRAVTNMRWDALGELRKRPTYASSAPVTAPSGATYSNAAALTIFPRESSVNALTHDFGVVTVDPVDPDSVLYQRREVTISSTTDSSLKYAPRGCRVSRRFIERSQFGQFEGIYQVASAVYSGVLVVAWIDVASPSALKVKAIDVDTGVVLSNVQYVGVTSTVFSDINAVPYTEAGKEGVLVTYSIGVVAPYTIATVRYQATTREFIADSSLTTTSAFSSHSLTSDAANGKVYVGYTDNAGAFPLLVKYGTIAQINGGTGTTHTATHTASYSCVVIGGTRVLIVSSSTSAFAEVFGTPASAVTLFAAAAGEAMFGVTAALEDNGSSVNRAVVYFSAYGLGTPATNRVRVATVDFTATTPVEGTNSLIPNAWAACAAFTYDGRAYGVFSLDPVIGEPTSLVVARYTELNASSGMVRHDPVARLCHDRFYSADLGVLSGAQSVSVVGDKVHLVLTADRTAARGQASNLFLAQTLFHSTIDFAKPVAAIEVNGAALLASGVTIEHDSDITSEHAPLVRPRLTVVQTATPSTYGSNITNCSVVAIYRWVDARGFIHRSAPSAPVETGAVTVAAERIDVYVSIPAFTAYLVDTSLTTLQVLEPELYITTDGGTTYYLAEEGTGEKKIQDGFDARSTTWVYEDVHPGLTSMPQIYSAGAGGSELVAEPPPSFLHWAHIGDRIIAIDAEDRTRIWPSKPMVSEISPEWSTANTFTVGDNAVAVVSLGGNPTFLCERGVWQVYGAGPDANGNGFFSPAQRISHECSCIDPLSVCRTPMGVVFRGRKGFYLINDGGQVTPFGLPIDPLTRVPSLSEYSYCRVVFDEVHNEVRVLDAENNRQFVFNLLEQKWSEWTQDANSQSAVDLTVCDGRVWYIHSGASAAIRREYGVDESQDVSLSAESCGIELPKVRVESVMGRGRLRELHLALKVRAAGDVNDTVSRVSALTVTLETFGAGSDATETFSWTGAQLAAIGDDDGEVLTLQLRPRNQRCTSFSVAVSEACSGAYSGSSPVALRLVMGADGKAMRHTRSGALKGAT